MKRLYDWTLRQAAHPQALWILAVISFIESSVFPIPPDIMMLPMMLARRAKIWLIATVATISSAAGALLGYAIGFFFLDLIGQNILQFYGYEATFSEWREFYQDYGFWVILGAGITPFPFKIITIASGALQVSLPLFILSCLIGRALRFYILAAVMWFGGPYIHRLLERHFGWVMSVFFFLLILGFVALKFLI